MPQPERVEATIKHTAIGLRDEVAIRIFVGMVTNASGGVSASRQWYSARATEALELATDYVEARAKFDAVRLGAGQS